MSVDAATDRLLDRAAALSGVVEVVAGFCKSSRELNSYPESTRALFEYVERAGGRTVSYIDEQIARVAQKPDWQRHVETGFATLRKFWSAVHRYVKPAAEAHALAAPHPLLKLATKRLSSVTGMSGARFVVLVAPELNYAHHTDARLKSLGFLFRDCPFPPDLGLVQVPYSAGASLFSNLLIYHELGHFAYSRLQDTARRAFDRVEQALTTALGRQISGFEGKDDPEKTKLSRTVRGWLKELFCDVFAIRLIGPAFSFAFWDFVSLLGADTEEANVFTSHPAQNARILYQKKQLIRDSWWPELESRQADGAIPVLQQMLRAPSDASSYKSAETNGTALVEVFFDCADTVLDLIADLTKGLPSSAPAFAANFESVAKLLANGIVPSVGITRDSGFAEEAVINAAYYFAVAQIGQLESRIRFPGEDRVKKRNRTRQRLDAWALKAVEDLQLTEAAP